MTMRWWTTSTNYNWTPKDGYSDLFKEYVRDIRKHFHLTKTGRTGIEVNEKGLWTPYQVQGENAMAIIDRFNWNGYDEWSETVYYMMNIRVAIKQRNLIQKLLGQEGNSLRVIFDEQVRVNFPRDFPFSPPQFNVQNPLFHVDDQHHHHLFSDGTLCIMAGNGDWDPEKDKILRAINAMVDWTVWHYKAWGSNPRRW